jgi:integrase
MSDCLERDEVDRILAAADTMPILDRTLLHFLLETGARRSEIAAIKVMDINLSDRKATIHGKSGKRILFFTRDCAGLLKRLMLGKADEQLVFSGQHGAMSGQKVYAIMRRAERLAGLDRPLNLHTLRRTFANMRAGSSPLHLAPLMDGGCPSSTLRYLKITGDEPENNPAGDDGGTDQQ